MRQVSGNLRGLKLRLFLVVVLFPIVSYQMRYWVLSGQDIVLVEASFLLVVKFLFVLVAIFYILWRSVRRREVEARLVPEIDKATLGEWRIAALAFISISMAANILGFSYIEIFFSIDAAIAFSLVVGNLPLTALLVLFSTFLGSKGALFFLLIFVFLRRGVSSKQLLLFFCAVPILPTLYLLGRVVSASIYLEGAFSITAILILFFDKIGDPQTLVFLLDSVTKRLNQYDGVAFVLNYGAPIDISVFDPGYLVERIIDSFTPFGAAVQSYGIMIGALMNPNVEFKSGFAGALGILGQISLADVIDIFVLLLICSIMASIGTKLFAKLPDKRAYLLFVSLSFVPLLMSGNLDTVLVLFLRNIFGLFILLCIRSFIHGAAKLKRNGKIA